MPKTKSKTTKPRDIVGEDEISEGNELAQGRKITIAMQEAFLNIPSDTRILHAQEQMQVIVWTLQERVKRMARGLSGTSSRHLKDFTLALTAVYEKAYPEGGKELALKKGAEALSWLFSKSDMAQGMARGLGTTLDITPIQQHDPPKPRYQPKPQGLLLGKIRGEISTHATGQRTALPPEPGLGVGPSERVAPTDGAIDPTPTFGE